LASTPLYWIDHVSPGRLAISARPRGNDWLEDEVSGWKRAGVQTVVSLLTPSEVGEMELSAEAESCRRNGIEFLSLEIPDRGLPDSHDEVVALAHQLAESVRQGKSVLIHCRAGIGRSTMLAAAVLVDLGESPIQALDNIAAARRLPVPDTHEQRQWILALARAVREMHA
jgi:protein-tyrosine phosphatase